MRKSYPLVLLSFVLLLYTNTVLALEPVVTITPDHILQGEPVMLTIENVTKLSDIQKILFDKKQISPFFYRSKVVALIGIDLNEKVGEHTLTITLMSGEILKQSIAVTKRDKPESEIGIPDKLGGNTKASQKKLVSNLKKENTIINTLTSNKKTLWKEPFIFPLSTTTIVDPYGYTRTTGEQTISHKGTDFRAPIGTKVFAMNRGVVRFTKKSLVYGNMVVLDHGNGLMTMYFHLSKIAVYQGQLVLQGQLLGLSGQTGYALGPHLHLSIRINTISIDPMKFMALFESK